MRRMWGSSALHDVTDVVGEHRLAADGIVGHPDRAALGVAHHDDEPRSGGRGRELDAAHERGRDDVAGNTDHEEVSEPLVEEELGWRTRVRAGQDDRQRTTRLHKKLSGILFHGQNASAAVLDETLVPLHQP